MMTACCFVYPALFSSLCLWFPRFSCFALAFTRHFRADFRLCYGILADSAFLCVVIGIIKEHPAVCLYAAKCSVFGLFGFFCLFFFPAWLCLNRFYQLLRLFDFLKVVYLYKVGAEPVFYFLAGHVFA